MLTQLGAKVRHGTHINKKSSLRFEGGGGTHQAFAGWRCVDTCGIESSVKNSTLGTKSTSKCFRLTLSCEGYCTPWLYCSTQHPSHAPTMWSITKRLASTPVHENCTCGWTFSARLLQNKSCKLFFQLSAFACKKPLHKSALRSKCWRPLSELSSHVNNMRRPLTKIYHRRGKRSWHLMHDGRMRPALATQISRSREWLCSLIL